nr:hypothetical protein Iba_chr07eCG3770 [Ipomoea batatas]
MACRDYQFNLRSNACLGRESVTFTQCICAPIKVYSQFFTTFQGLKVKTKCETFLTTFLMDHTIH